MESSIFSSLKDSIHKMFESTYTNFGWHMGHGESRSGTGSSLEYSENFSKNLVNFIKENNVKSIFDCSCGDWNWMQHISHNFEYYIGNDASDSVIKANKERFENEKIKFIYNDAVSELKKYGNKEFDLIICRQTLEHLPTDYNILLLNEIKRVAKFAVITSTSSYVGDGAADIKMNGFSSRSVNLHLHPYLSILGNPIIKFSDTSKKIGIMPEEFISEDSLGCFGNIYKL